MKANNQNKFCSRCKAEINCLVSDINNCECSKVNLNHDTLHFLKSTNYQCLCNKCLLMINEMVIKSKQYQFPKSRTEMIEGVHFYLENGYFIFTELYHMLRGKCCQSGCRHCAYGFKKI